MIKLETKISEGVPFECKRVTGKNWRLVHDGKVVITKIEGTDQNVTNTKQIVSEHATEEEMDIEIEKLGLTDVIIVANS